MFLVIKVSSIDNCVFNNCIVLEKVMVKSEKDDYDV